MSEIFHSLQGEGRHLGVPSVFLRLARCNLACCWCDTPYSWDFARYDYEREVTELDVSEVVERLLQTGAPHLVVTGGEPLLQQRVLPELLEGLDREALAAGRAPLFVEVETNGTVPPSASLVARIDQWNVSPKLSSSEEPEERRLRWKTLEALRDTHRADLKLVVRDVDLAEADELIERLHWPRERVFLMPQAADRQELAQHGPLVSAAALSRNVRYSSRLHVELFGGKRGV